jgi:peptidoglycan/LPS O-acetylase OafA/YrhL
MNLNQQFNKNPLLSWLASTTGIQSILDKRVDASYLPAGSTEQSENTTQLQTQPASLRNPLSLLVGVCNFLFVPTPFVDNGSFFLNAQSYESFAWYFYYLILILLLIGLIRRRYVLNLVTLSSTLFSLGFIAMSALIEINDGTSVRHRAVLLIGILVMLATFQRKQPDHPEHQSSKILVSNQ